MGYPMNSEQIAKQICDFIAEHPVSSEHDIAEIISQALQSHEQAIRAEYRALARKWREYPNQFDARIFHIAASEIEGIK